MVNVKAGALTLNNKKVLTAHAVDGVRRALRRDVNGPPEKLTTTINGHVSGKQRAVRAAGLLELSNGKRRVSVGNPAGELTAVPLTLR